MQISDDRKKYLLIDEIKRCNNKYIDELNYLGSQIIIFITGI